jgi:L-ribulose-5-phosphate 4-epimerase
MLDELREQVLKANLEIQASKLALFTWGNASGLDRDKGLVVIKPSGVPYETMTAADLVVVDLSGRVVEGSLKPSSDTPTHLELYRVFTGIAGVAHCHPTHATMWAQARQPLPCFGTTHADHFDGTIPVTRDLSADRIAEAYELETGRAIVDAMAGLDPLAMPAVLVASHGPFTWGRSAAEAVHHMAVLEEVARMALGTRLLDPAAGPIAQALLNRHYQRKHGPTRTYGQGPA